MHLQESSLSEWMSEPAVEHPKHTANLRNWSQHEVVKFVPVKRGPGLGVQLHKKSVMNKILNTQYHRE